MNIDISGIPVNIFELIILGCIIGFLSGFFGIGGGALVTPILHIFFGLPFPIGIGSTLSQTAGTSFSATLRYRHYGDVDLKLALTILGGNVVGIKTGVYLLDWLGKLGNVKTSSQSIPAIQFYLQWLFFGLLIGIAILIIIESLRSKLHTEVEAKGQQKASLLQRLPIPPYVSFPTSGIQKISLVVVVYASLLIGLLTGLLGIGGGVISVPLLIYGYGAETRTAIGTALLLVFFSSTYGTVEHALRGNVDLRLVVLLMSGSTIFAQLGAIASRTIQGSSIRFYFAFIVLIVAGIIFFNLMRLIYG